MTFVINLPGELEKFLIFKNSKHQEFFTNFIDSNFSKKAKDRSIFFIFLAVLSALEVSVNLTSLKFHGCKMIGKMPKTLIKL